MKICSSSSHLDLHRDRGPNRRTTRGKGEDLLPCHLFSDSVFSLAPNLNSQRMPAGRSFRNRRPVLSVAHRGFLFQSRRYQRALPDHSDPERHHLLGKPYAHLTNSLNGSLRRKELDSRSLLCINRRDHYNVDKH